MAETSGRFCPFRSVIPTTQAKLGHAVTGMSERDCDGDFCMLWVEQGGKAGCAFAVLAQAAVERLDR